MTRDTVMGERIDADGHTSTSGPWPVGLPALAGEVPESTEARGARNLGPKKYHKFFCEQNW